MDIYSILSRWKLSALTHLKSRVISEFKNPPQDPYDRAIFNQDKQNRFTEVENQVEKEYQILSMALKEYEN